MASLIGGARWRWMGVVLLAASLPARADTKPDAFNFLDDVVPGAQGVRSNAVTVSGIDAPATLKLTGHASGRFQVNDGPLQKGSATVAAGDTVRLQLTSAGAGAPGARTVTVRIGGIADTWTVTTIPEPAGASGPPPADKVFNLGGTSAGQPCSGTVRCVTAGQSIQAAIDASADGDTIQVQAGTYAGNLQIAGKTVRLLGGFPVSGFASRRPLANATILRGTGGNAVVTLDQAGTSVVDGFRIRKGTGNLFYGGHGGGVFVNEGRVRVSNNVIENNEVCGPGDTECRGGGIYVLNGDDVEIAGNIIRNNLAARGAGIGVGGHKVTIRDNLVENNHGTSDHGGGLYLFGELHILRNIVRGNSIGQDVGYGWGAGITVVEAGGVANFEYNRVTDNASPSAGSGVFIDEGATANFHGDLVYANGCGVYNTGVYVDGSYDGRGSIARFTNVTIASHPCPDDYPHGLFAEGGSRVVVTNSVFFGNGSTDAGYFDCTDPDVQSCAKAMTPTTLSITYSLLKGFRGGNNIRGNPLFADAASGDYHLLPGSPAIDAADPSSPVGDEPAPNGGRRDMGSYGGTSGATVSE